MFVWRCRLSDLSLIFVVAMAFGCCCSAVAEESAAKKVIACYNAGNVTMSTLHACSGLWVTQRALTLCFLEAQCPAIEDTPLARSFLEREIGSDTFDKTITVQMIDVLAVPQRKLIEDCKSSSGGKEEQFLICVSGGMAPPSVSALQACTRLPDKEKALCLTAGSPEFYNIVGCVSTKERGMAGALSCFNGDVDKALANAQSCIMKGSESEAVKCITGDLGDDEKQLADCLGGAGSSADTVLGCLKSVNAAQAARIDEAICVTKAADSIAAVACVSKSFGGTERS